MNRQRIIDRPRELRDHLRLCRQIGLPVTVVSARMLGSHLVEAEVAW